VYRLAGRIEHVAGVASWEEAAAFVEAVSSSEPIEEVQYWGHGRFGRVLVDRTALDARSLQSASPARFFALLRERFAPGERSLFWMRTCESFGAEIGRDFASRLSDFLGVSVAGNTHFIGFWLSGLHGLRPGATPTWSSSEGIEKGTPEAPELGVWSTPMCPRTIHCLEGSVPPVWFDGAQCGLPPA
jgi:hypothetical protein